MPPVMPASVHELCHFHGRAGGLAIHGRVGDSFRTGGFTDRRIQNRVQTVLRSSRRLARDM